jgi:hypothetical protein
MLEGTWDTAGRPAWVAYVTTDDVVVAEPVPARLKTSVFWQNGMVVSPLASALRPQAVALGDVVCSFNAGTSSHATTA